MIDVEVPSIVIAGAGLTGLAASVRLRKIGVPHRVLEASEKPGGLARTVEEAGYRFDRTGHLLHLRDEELRGSIIDMLGEHAVVELERRAVVFSHGVATPYPFQSNVHGLPAEVKYACVHGFVRAQMAPKKPSPPRTFEEFCLRHFGEGISRAFMIPYNEKAWGIHPSELSAAWCERFVPIPTLDDVLRGAFGLVTAPLGYNTRFLYPRLGTNALVDALADRAGRIETQSPVISVDWRERAVQTRDARVPFTRLISSMPLDRLVATLVDPPAEILAAAAKLRHVRLHYLDLALNTPCERPWHWVYVPEPRFPFYRVGCYSNFSSAMAPGGKGSIWVELVGREPPDMPAVLGEVADGLVEMGLIRAREAIRFARARTIEHAYVVYDDEREAAVSTIQNFLREQGIMSVGRYGAWEYASMEDALIAGNRAADEALP